MRPIWVFNSVTWLSGPRGGMSVMSELSESHRLVTIQRSLLTRLAAQRRLETVEQAVTRSGLAHMVSGLT